MPYTPACLLACSTLSGFDYDDRRVDPGVLGGHAPPTPARLAIRTLDAPERTPAGDRLYSDRDLERLRLIARAKDLGCTLGAAGLVALAPAAIWYARRRRRTTPCAVPEDRPVPVVIAGRSRPPAEPAASTGIRRP